MVNKHTKIYKQVIKSYLINLNNKPKLLLYNEALIYILNADTVSQNQSTPLYQFISIYHPYHEKLFSCLIL